MCLVHHCIYIAILAACVLHHILIYFVHSPHLFSEVLNILYGNMSFVYDFSLLRFLLILSLLRFQFNIS